jgi:hypothetical protein
MNTTFTSYQQGSTVYCDISQGCAELVDSFDRTICAQIEILACGSGDPDNPCGTAVVNNGLLLCTCEGSDRCPLCENDLPFNNILNYGDEIFIQLQQIDNVTGQDPNGTFPDFEDWAFIGIKDCCSGDLVQQIGGGPLNAATIATSSFVGVFPVRNYRGEISWSNIQTIKIDSDEIFDLLAAQFPEGNGCFSLVIEGEYLDFFLCSQPYKRNPCPEKKSTILLEGIYQGTDSFGYYYGEEAIGTGLFTYSNQYRVEGVVEQLNFDISKEKIGNRMIPTSSTILGNYSLRTQRTPSSIARLITNILAAPDVRVDGFAYLSDGEVSKNNEIGNQWFVEARLQRIVSQQSFNCNK